jgi:hypothetical protein
MVTYEVLYNQQQVQLEKIRRELLALKADAISRRIPCTTSDFTGIADRINEILALYANH